jgi:hypothetical protein
MGKNSYSPHLVVKKKMSRLKKTLLLLLSFKIIKLVKNEIEELQRAIAENNIEEGLLC